MTTNSTPADPFERARAEKARRLAAQKAAEPKRSSADRGGGGGGKGKSKRRPGPPRGWWALIKAWLDHGALGRCTGNGPNVYLALLRLAKAYRKPQEGENGRRRLGEYKGGRKRLGALCGGVHVNTVSNGLRQLELRGIIECRQVKHSAGGSVQSSMIIYILDVPSKEEGTEDGRLEGME